METPFLLFELINELSRFYLQDLSDRELMVATQGSPGGEMAAAADSKSAAL